MHADAMRRAIDQMLRGEQVMVDDIVRDMNMVVLRCVALGPDAQQCNTVQRCARVARCTRFGANSQNTRIHHSTAK